MMRIVTRLIESFGFRNVSHGGYIDFHRGSESDNLVIVAYVLVFRGMSVTSSSAIQ